MSEFLEKRLINTAEGEFIRKIKELLRDRFCELDIDLELFNKVFSKKFFENGSIYLFFPAVFRKFLSAEKHDKFLVELCQASFLYYKYLISIDEVIDDDKHEFLSRERSAFSGLKAHIYAHESYKILISLFPGNFEFWKYWDLRNNEFLNSITLDKQYSPRLHFNEYFELATKKCAFNKVAIDAIKSVEKSLDDTTHREICEGIDLFSVASCLLDDFEDLESDFLHKKNNFGHVLLQEKLTTDIQTLKLHEFKKFILEKQTAEELLAYSVRYFDLAEEKIAQLGNGDGLEILSEMIFALRSKVAMTRASLITKRVTHQKYADPGAIKVRTVEDSITDATDYLRSVQNEDGSWQDIDTKKRISDAWCTGFVGLNLIPEESDARRKAANFLKHSSNQGLWAYNNDFQGLEDFDASTTALMTMHLAGEDISKMTPKWLEGYSKGEGFTTYLASNRYLMRFLGARKTEQIRGWTTGHVCVSSLAFFFLCQRGLEELSEVKDDLREFLFSSMGDNGVLPSYWWTSDVYSTYYFLKGLAADGYQGAEELFDEKLKVLLRNNTLNGVVKSDLLFEDNILYGGMVLDLICTYNKLAHDYKAEANEIVGWMLSNQFENGSFKNGHVLMFPEPDEIEQNHEMDYVADYKSNGGWRIGTEIGGLYSTTMAVKSLKAYQEVLIYESAYH